MNKDIIPITYLSGTGGVFLSKFITTAKLNIQDPITFLSKHGNAHSLIWTELSGSGTGPASDDRIKIQKLLSNLPKENSLPIYFPHDHILDLELCTKFFEKVIRITIETDDIQQVALVYTGKHQIDHLQKDKQTKIFNIKWETYMYISIYAKYFTNKEQLPNVLYISWKELVHYDPNILINKLHNFTLIPKKNFNIENLIIWRKATISCIETISLAK